MSNDKLREHLLNYVNPQGPLPDMAFTKSGSVLILCGGPTLEDDVKRYDKSHKGDRVVVNEAYTRYKGKADHAMSLDPDDLNEWIQFRKNPKTRRKCLYHSHEFRVSKYPVRWVGFDDLIIWPLQRDGGTSGLFSVLVGLLMGYESVVLAGCPLTDHYERRDHDRLVYHDEWKRAIKEVPFDNRVKSLSGYTRDWLGEP